jgi:NADH-quinone oxidoreductase subunit J
VLVYVGAVMVLFLFVVMMMDINLEGLRREFWKHFPFAAIVGVVIALEMSAVLMGGFRMLEDSNAAAAATAVLPVSNTKELGKLLYTQYLYPLEVAAGVLLVAMIAAIALTLRERKDSKFISPSDQVRVTSKDRLTVVKLASTQPAVVPPAAEEAAQAEKKA